MLLEYLRIGFQVLRAHKFRAALTVLSITVGAFSVVVMSSLAKSGVASLSRGIEEIGGARMISFMPKQPEKAERKRESYSRGITIRDVDALRGRVPHARYLEMHALIGDRDVTYEGRPPKRADFVGANQDFLGAFAVKLAGGRNIDAEDLLGRRRVAVIGHGVAEKLFTDAEAPLGRIVRIGSDSYRVIGVAAKVKRFGAQLGFDYNDFVAVPITTATGGLFGEGNGFQAGALLVVTTEARHNEIAKRVASAILLDRHHGVDDFQAFDFGQLMEKFYKVFDIMRIIVAFIAGIALVVGGVGIMNILLVSVRERVREIGIRKALGAPSSAIGLQFLFEGAVMSGVGGLVGAGGGMAIALASGVVIQKSQEAWVGGIAYQAVAGALCASIVIGVVFGLLPARRAARMQVVECLRANG